MRWSFLHVAGHVSEQSIVDNLKALNGGHEFHQKTPAHVEVPAAFIATESVRDRTTWIVPLSTRSSDSCSRHQLEIACDSRTTREVYFERLLSSNEGIMLSERQIQMVWVEVRGSSGLIISRMI